MNISLWEAETIKIFHSFEKCSKISVTVFFNPWPPLYWWEIYKPIFERVQGICRTSFFFFKNNIKRIELIVIYRIYLGCYSLALAVRSPYLRNKIDHFLPPCGKFLNFVSSGGCSPILLHIVFSSAFMNWYNGKSTTTNDDLWDLVVFIELSKKLHPLSYLSLMATTWNPLLSLHHVYTHKGARWHLLLTCESDQQSFISFI